jgi:hypothetical protein
MSNVLEDIKKMEKVTVLALVTITDSFLNIAAEEL